jgi:hypothetical protein
LEQEREQSEEAEELSEEAEGPLEEAEGPLEEAEGLSEEAEELSEEAEGLSEEAEGLSEEAEGLLEEALEAYMGKEQQGNMRLVPGRVRRKLGVRVVQYRQLVWINMVLFPEAPSSIEKRLYYLMGYWLITSYSELAANIHSRAGDSMVMVHQRDPANRMVATGLLHR